MRFQFAFYLVIVFSGPSSFAMDRSDCARVYEQKAERIRWLSRSLEAGSLVVGAGGMVTTLVLRDTLAAMVFAVPFAATLAISAEGADNAKFYDKMALALSEGHLPEPGSAGEALASFTNRVIFEKESPTFLTSLEGADRLALLIALNWQPLQVEEVMSIVRHLQETGQLCTESHHVIGASRWFRSLLVEGRAVRSTASAVFSGSEH